MSERATARKGKEKERAAALSECIRCKPTRPSSLLLPTYHFEIDPKLGASIGWLSFPSARPFLPPVHSDQVIVVVATRKRHGEKQHKS